jgi:hypothetical protein
MTLGAHVMPSTGRRERLLKAEEIVGVIGRFDVQEPAVVLAIVGAAPIEEVRIGEVGIDASRPRSMQ